MQRAALNCKLRCCLQSSHVTLVTLRLLLLLAQLRLLLLLLLLLLAQLCLLLLLLLLPLAQLRLLLLLLLLAQQRRLLLLLLAQQPAAQLPCLPRSAACIRCIAASATTRSKSDRRSLGKAASCPLGHRNCE